MGTKILPAKFESTCDVCGKVHVSDSQQRPDHWAEVTLARHAYDYQGNACADGTKKFLICDECHKDFAATFNKWAEARRANPDVRATL